MKDIFQAMAISIFILMTGVESQAHEVVTIYFAGTGATEDWWDAGNTYAQCNMGEFRRPYGVSALHHAQDDSALNQYKFFVDGICTGCDNSVIGCIAMVAGCAKPEWDACSGGWKGRLEKAEKFLMGVLDQSQCDIIVNLVGHSRGGILAITFANHIQEAAYLDKVKQINILAIDPVAGEDRVFQLSGGKTRNYVGIYATDERSHLFSPTIPLIDPSIEQWLFRVPGSHETLTGNTQTDGHAVYKAPYYLKVYGGADCWNLQGRCYKDSTLKKVSNVVNTIIVELLSSPQWGNVNFNEDRLKDRWGGRLYDESEFIQTVESMWKYNYKTMRLISSTVAFESFKDNSRAVFLTFADWAYHKGYKYDRFYTGTDETGDGEYETYHRSLNQDVLPLDDGNTALSYLQRSANQPSEFTRPVPVEDPLPVVAGQCSAKVATVPKASVRCYETIEGTTQDPLEYAEQGSYTVTWTYDDGRGNQALQKQTVTVSDTIPPEMSCPDNITLECDQESSPDITGLPTATDNCDSDPAVDYLDAVTPGYCPQVKTIERVWTSTDRYGNQSSCLQTITIQDTTAPVISCNAPESITPPDVPITLTASALDNCSPSPRSDVTGYDCFMFTKNGKRVDKTDSCEVRIEGGRIEILESGGVGDNITWTVRSVDSCGNTSQSECQAGVVKPGRKK